MRFAAHLKVRVGQAAVVRITDAATGAPTVVRIVPGTRPNAGVISEGGCTNGLECSVDDVCIPVVGGRILDASYDIEQEV